MRCFIASKCENKHAYIKLMADGLNIPGFHVENAIMGELVDNIFKERESDNNILK